LHNDFIEHSFLFNLSHWKLYLVLLAITYSDFNKSLVRNIIVILHSCQSEVVARNFLNTTNISIKNKELQAEKHSD